ncbi:MAG: hypothetical protein KAJ19_08630, partial [Gammaproteobacteria bacterium]|nr:hypothetical protein [Gammaproteobacteria bacterium]
TTGQIIRMYSAGAASADMFRERGVLAMLGFQAKVSYSASETRAQLMKMFEDPKSQFKGAATALAKTWSGMLSMMSDRWFQFRNLVMDAGVFEFIKAGLGLWLKSLEDLKKEGKLDEWAEQMADVVIRSMSNIAIAVGWVMDAFRGLKMMIDGLKLLFALMGKVAGDESKDMVKNQKGFLDVAKSYNEVQESIGNKAVEISRKLQDAYGPDSGIDKWVGWWAGAFEKVGESIAEDGKRGAAMMDRWKGKAEEVNKQADELDSWFSSILTSTLASLEATAGAVPWNERIKAQLKEMLDLIAEQRAARKAATAEEKKATEEALTIAVPRGEPTETGTLADRLRKEMIKYRETTKTQLAALNAEWEKHQHTVEGYFAVRKARAEAAFQHDLKRLQELADAEEAPKKKEKLLLDIFKLQEAHKRTMIALATEEDKALKDRIAGEKESAQLVADAAGRAATEGGGGLAVQFAEQLREMEGLQRTEMDKLQELRAAGHATEQQEQDLHNAQMLEKERLLADQRKQVIDTYFGSVTGMLDDVSSAFLDMYKATGSDNKAFFEIYKAAAVAKTIISTIQSAQDAYKAEMELGGPGAKIRAVAAAVFASAAGAGRVAQIRAQSMAEGGSVGDYTRGGRIAGTSPHDKADNVRVNATAGEYMHPVSAVRHYGLPAMDAIRKKLVPRAVLAAFANPAAAMPMGAS